MKHLLIFILWPLLCFTQTQIGQDINGEATGDQSGYSVSISSDGSVMAIGAYNNDGNGSNSGQVRIYQNQSGTWSKIGQDIDGEAPGDFSGFSVGLSSDGDVVAVGATNNNGNGTSSGQVRIYENKLGIWTKIGQDIDGLAAFNLSGWSVSLSSNGSMVAIGAIGYNGAGEFLGSTRVFQNQSGTWIQIGQTITGEANFDFSGWSVSLSADGSIVALGATYNDGNGNEAGNVRIFENQSGTWVQIGQDINGENPGDQSGHSVSLSADGSIVAISATYNNDSGQQAGHVRVYHNQSGNWVQLGQDIDGEVANEQSGQGISLSSDGTILAIGAYSNSTNGASSGQVRIYKYIAGTWSQFGSSINGEAANDWSGWSVSLSSDGSQVAIGAPNNDGNGADSGHVRVYDLTAVLSIHDFLFNNYTIYPNPATNFISVKFNGNLVYKETNIYGITGNLIRSTFKETIDISDLSSGIYLVEIITDLGVSVKKIVKK